jgi:hypothetical protein
MEKKKFYDSAIDFCQNTNILPKKGADKNGRNMSSSYRKAEGEVHGVAYLATAWHPIGHTVCVSLTEVLCS